MSNEINEWSHLNLSIKEVVTVKDFGNVSDYDITVINVHILEKFLAHISTFEFNMVVFDESTLFKNYASKRFKAIYKYLCKVDPAYRVNLTGTPMPNGYGNLFSQYKLLDDGERLGCYITHFRNEFMKVDWSGYNFTLRDGKRKDLHARIKDITLSFKPKDIVKQKLIYTFDKIQMTPKLKKRYDELRDTNMLMLDELDFDNPASFIEASTNGILNNKLLQFSNGSIRNTETDSVEHIHDLKLTYLKEFMRDFNDNVIVMYSHTSDKKKLLDTFKYAKTPNIKNLQGDWNDGKIKMMVAHPASIGHGLNLQYGGYTIIWYGLTYDLELYQQTNKRLHRRGQTQPVVIKHLIVGDVEEKLVRSLNQKALQQDEVMNIGKK